MIPPWTQLALCARISDPDSFFPENGDVLPALTVCRQCPVRVECLEWALETEDRIGLSFGIYGATTARERRQILAQRPTVPCRDCGTAVPRRKHATLPLCAGCRDRRARAGDADYRRRRQEARRAS